MILQVSWFIEFVPRWFSIILIMAGFTLGVAGFTPMSSGTILSEVDSIKSLLAFMLLLIGLNLYIYGFINQFPNLQVIAILALAKYIEGISAAQLIRKIEAVARTGSLSAASTGGIKRRIISRLLTVLVGLIIFIIIVGIAIWGPVEFEFDYTVRLIWTLVTVVSSVLGLSAKYWKVTGQTNLFLFFGSLLMITGAEIYNMSSIQMDVITYIIGNIVYFSAYLISMYIFWKGIDVEKLNERVANI